jgi:hypothetical protein
MPTDTERLDWVEKLKSDVVAGKGVGDRFRWFVYTDDGNHQAIALRDAIDAAMSSIAVAATKGDE